MKNEEQDRLVKLVNNSVPTGGDSSPYKCPKCDSPNTTFLEYQSAYAPDFSELGIICDECEHEIEPDELGHLLEPEWKE